MKRSPVEKTLEAMRKDHLAPQVNVRILADDIEKFIQRMVETAVRTCVNCEHFECTTQHKTADICRLAMQRPPATVIVSGCEKHEWNDEIPF